MPNKLLCLVSSMLTFNANLQTDMGKTIVRRHLTTADAQSIWRELSEHIGPLPRKPLRREDSPNMSPTLF